MIASLFTSLGSGVHKASSLLFPFNPIAISPKKSFHGFSCLGACFLEDPTWTTSSFPSLSSVGERLCKGKDRDHRNTAFTPLSARPPPIIPALGITQVSLLNPAASQTQTSEFSCTLGSPFGRHLHLSLSRLPNETWDTSCHRSRWYPRKHLLHYQLSWGRNWSLLELRRQAERLAPSRRPLRVCEFWVFVSWRVPKKAPEATVGAGRQGIGAGRGEGKNGAGEGPGRSGGLGGGRGGRRAERPGRRCGRSRRHRRCVQGEGRPLPRRPRRTGAPQQLLAPPPRSRHPRGAPRWGRGGNSGVAGRAVGAQGRALELR